MATANEAMQNEVWKSPPSIKCLRVEVSNFGRVRTLPYERCFLRLGKPRINKCKGRILKLHKDSRGRFFICGGTVKKSMVGKGLLVHRLVAECFVPNPKPRKYDMVFFKDGDLGNCKDSNLEWGCRRDRDMMARGNRAAYKISVFSNGVKVGEYIGCGECGRALGCTKQAIHSALMRGNFCKGYKLVAVKCDGDKPYHSLEEARKDYRGSPSNKLVEIPDAIFSVKDVEIPHRAVFE